MSIIELSSKTVNLIKSSQVITSVTSIVKELLENSLDASSSTISVKLENFGFNKLEVKDNGVGIKEEDVPFFAKPHFTSKIENFEDLDSLSTYGFRGEALSSLCAVADVTMNTKRKDDTIGFSYAFTSAGDIKNKKPTALTTGTCVIIQNLFKNIPVRRNYYSDIKRKKEELRKIENLVKAYAVIRPNVHLSLLHDKNLVFQKPASNTVRISIHSVFKELTKKLFFKELKTGNLELQVWLPEKSEPCCSASSAEKLFVIINDRPIMHKAIEKLVKAFYSGKEDGVHGKYPIGVVYIKLPAQQLDVNLEPNKTRVYFKDEDFVLESLRRALTEIYGEVLPAAKVPKGEQRNGEDDLPCTLATSLSPSFMHCQLTNRTSQAILDLQSKELENNSSVCSNLNITSCEQLKAHLQASDQEKNISESILSSSPEPVLIEKPQNRNRSSSPNSNDLTCISNSDLKNANDAVLTTDEITLPKNAPLVCLPLNTEVPDKGNNKSNEVSRFVEDKGGTISSVCENVSFFDEQISKTIDQTSSIDASLPVENRTLSDRCPKEMQLSKQGNTITNSTFSSDYKDARDISLTLTNQSAFHNIVKHSTGESGNLNIDSSVASVIENMPLNISGEVASINNDFHTNFNSPRKEVKVRSNIWLQHKKEPNEFESETLNKRGDKVPNINLANLVSSSSIASTSSCTVGNVSHASWSMGNVAREGRNIQNVELLHQTNVLIEDDTTLVGAPKRRLETELSPSKEIQVQNAKRPKASAAKKLLEKSFQPLSSPKRIESAFSLFAKTTRKQMLEADPGTNFTVVAQEIAMRWKNADSDIRKMFEDKAKEINEMNSSRVETKRIRPEATKKPYQNQNETKVKLEPVAKVKPWHSKSLQVPFSFDHLKQKINNRKRLKMPSEDFVGCLKGINGWIYRHENSICAFNSSRLNEVVLFKTLLNSFMVPTIKLDNPIVLNPEVLGLDPWNVLIRLNHKPSTSLNELVVTDLRIASNGFKIALFNDRDSSFIESGEIAGIADSVPNYGLRDLREVLTRIVESPDIPLGPSRPQALFVWFQMQSMRMAQASPHIRELCFLKEKFNLWAHKQHFSDRLIAECLHGKPIFSVITTLEQH